MRSNFSVNFKGLETGALRAALKEPRVFLRVIVGVLLLANLVAAAIVFKPWAGSAEDLEREAAGLRKQVHDQQASLDHLRTVVKKVKAARTDGDTFLDTYLLSRKTAPSNLAGELDGMAKQAGIRQAETNVNFEPIEGTDAIAKATVVVNYQGTYADLMQLLSLMDRSPRFLIVESLRAAPQQSSQLLNITMKVDAFVREGGPDQQLAAAGNQPPAAQQPAAAQAAPASKPQAASVVPSPRPPAIPATPGRGFAPAVPANGPPPAGRPRPGFSPGKQVIR